MKVYLVGGAVRDQLLNLPIHERDYVVVGATPEQMLEKGYKPVGKDFPVFLHPETKEEYALARTERKVGKGYKGFDCYAAPDVTLEDDLLRRDLTINAMAQTDSGEIIDPYSGQDDLKNRKLRHVSLAFREDPLRILRLARFAARFHSFDFEIATETQHLLYEMVREGELTDLVPDRVWLEVEKVLGCDHPEQFFHHLRQFGALKQLFPELDALFGVPNPPQWHPEIDTGVHSLMVLAQAVKLSQDKSIRFAALVHDLGKAVTSQNIWPSHHGHDLAGVEGIKSLCARYPIPKNYRELGILASRYHIECHKIMSASPKAILNLLEALDAFRRPSRLDQFLTVTMADARGRLGNEADPYPQQQHIREAFRVSSEISTEEIIQAGFQGKAIADELYAQRLKVITSKLFS